MASARDLAVFVRDLVASVKDSAVSAAGDAEAVVGSWLTNQYTKFMYSFYDLPCLSCLRPCHDLCHCHHPRHAVSKVHNSHLLDLNLTYRIGFYSTMRTHFVYNTCLGHRVVT